MNNVAMPSDTNLLGVQQQQTRANTHHHQRQQHNSNNTSAATTNGNNNPRRLIDESAIAAALTGNDNDNTIIIDTTPFDGARTADDGGSASPYLACDEDATTCLLLPATPSPPTLDWIDPLQAANGDAQHAAHANGGGGGGGDGAATDDTRAETSSSTSGSSGIGMELPAAVIAGTTTLYNNKHVYQNLDHCGETIQQNGGVQYATLNIQITKDTPGFVHWNWPLIRQCSFVAFMAGVLAMAVLVVAMIAALPRYCDPKTQWFNGGVFYEIFPASYHDFDGDGVGDLLGLTARVPYIHSLGVRAVRLNSIFDTPHYPDDYATNVTSLMRMAPVLGDQRELRMLADALHARNISLVLDLPVWPLLAALPEVADGRETTIITAEDTGAGDELTASTAAEDATTTPVTIRIDDATTTATAFGADRRSRSLPVGADGDPILAAMQHWLWFGVDGFYVRGLEHFAADATLLANVLRWKRELGEQRVLIVGEAVLHGVTDTADWQPQPAAAESSAEAVVTMRDELIESVDLFDVTLHLDVGTAALTERIMATIGATGALPAGAAGRAQVHWTLASGRGRIAGQSVNQPLHRSRIATQRSTNATLAATLMQLMLPGTPSIFYGDEIGLRNVHDAHGAHSDTRALHHLAPMAWRSGDAQFTGSRHLPWMPAGAGTPEFANAAAVGEMIRLRGESPSLYMEGICKSKSPTQQTPKVVNTVVRTSAVAEVMLVERWYPRRASFVAITNWSAASVRLDLSKRWFGGEVVAGGRRGERVLFRDFEIGAEQTMVMVLDK